VYYVYIEGTRLRLARRKSAPRDEAYVPVAPVSTT
jgi:hypothetical protein